MYVKSHQNKEAVSYTDEFSIGRIRSIDNTKIVNNFMLPLSKKLYES